MNAAVFYGKLPNPKEIKFIEHKASWAWAIPDEHGAVSMSIVPKFKTRRLFLTIVVHEMVHGWEHMHHKRMGHGKRFFEWKYRIRRTTTLRLERLVGER